MMIEKPQHYSINYNQTVSFQNTTDAPKETTEENFADFSKFENSTATSHSNENITRFVHKRSASLDSTHVSKQ